MKSCINFTNSKFLHLKTIILLNCIKHNFVEVKNIFFEKLYKYHYFEVFIYEIKNNFKLHKT